ncbi:MAG: hypothetical protein HQL11_05825 [Candidatus Omnitrophica bacterium]|nr:hypothetical protein [Candidatus Omnitrophota bacterium]
MATRLWGEFLRKDALKGTYELGVVCGTLKLKVSELLEPVASAFGDGANGGAASGPQKPKGLSFRQELQIYLIKKWGTMFDGILRDEEFEKLTNQIFRLLQTSLASNRTADEIVNGLREDPQMRGEVVQLVIHEAKLKEAIQKSRIFLNRIFGGDEDLRDLLKRQTLKEGFPHAI